jgi:hypothetical protein
LFASVSNYLLNAHGNHTPIPRTPDQRYYIGHYNPRGNHFFAYGIKKAVVDLLKPQPPAITCSIAACTRW